MMIDTSITPYILVWLLLLTLGFVGLIGFAVFLAGQVAGLRQTLDQIRQQLSNLATYQQITEMLEVRQPRRSTSSRHGGITFRDHAAVQGPVVGGDAGKDGL